MLGFVEPFAQLGDIEVGGLGDVLVPNAERQRLLVQSLTFAFWALTDGKKLVCPFLPARAVVVFHHLAEVFDDAIESDEIVARRMDKFLGDADAVQRAIEDFRQGFLRDFFHGGLHGAFVLLQQRVDLPEYHLVAVFAQWGDSAFGYRQMLVGNHLVEVYLIDVTQSLAMRTGSLG